MKILGWEFDKTKYKANKPVVEASTGHERHLFSIFNGEKNPGELGALVEYGLDYEGLRMRSWESYLSSEITRTVVGKYSKWVIGSGLKFQSEPVANILKENNIVVEPKTIKSIENRFKIYANSPKVDYSEKKNLHQIASTVLVNTIVGGDVLVVLRLEKGNINVQLIDGANIKQPFWSKYFSEATKRGNTILNGIEIDKRGRNVAFYIKTGIDEIERILARNPKTGREKAFMVYGSEYRLSDNRGMPKLSASLETLKKLDRYKEATVGGAEERANIAMIIEHGLGSDGENPLSKSMAKSFDYSSDSELPTDLNGKALQDNVAATMGKTVINLPQDAKMKALESKQEINYDGFYSPNVNSICASIGIPPDVALSKYDGSYSSSRASLKDWEHTLGVDRKNFDSQFYYKVFEYWLDVQVMSNNIQLKGYINALVEQDYITLAAFRNGRFVGSNVPHIDPLKEVAAQRLLLGKTGASIPLTTAAGATEALDSGDYDTNVMQYASELDESKLLKIIEEPKVVAPLKEEKPNNKNK
jgi:hypothetical protein